MITYKPSARLGTLNEEDFTSDPTARGWSITNNGTGSYAFNGTYGLQIISTTAGPVTDLTIENTTTKLQQYLSLKFYNVTATRSFSPVPVLKIYLDDVEVISVSLSSASSGNDFYGLVNINLFKNTPTDYKYNYIIAQTSNSIGNNNYYSGTVNLNKNSVSKIKITVTSNGAGYSPQYLYITNLKWV